MEYFHKVENIRFFHNNKILQFIPAPQFKMLFINEKYHDTIVYERNSYQLNIKDEIYLKISKQDQIPKNKCI